MDIVRRLTWAAGGIASAKLLIGRAVHMPDAHVVRAFLETSGSPLLRLYDLLVGGGLAHGSVFALGIMPWLSAKLYVALAKRVTGPLKSEKWLTRGLTVGLSIVQAYGYARFTEMLPGAVASPGAAYLAQVTLLLAGASTVLGLFAEEAVSSDAPKTTPLLQRESVEAWEARARNDAPIHITPITPLP